MEEKGVARRVHLVQAEEQEPRVRLKPGKRYEVVSTTLVDSDFRSVRDEKGALRPARLCGGTSTCLAIVEVQSRDEP